MRDYEVVPNCGGAHASNGNACRIRAYGYYVAVDLLGLSLMTAEFACLRANSACLCCDLGLGPLGGGYDLDLGPKSTIIGVLISVSALDLPVCALNVSLFGPWEGANRLVNTIISARTCSYDCKNNVVIDFCGLEGYPLGILNFMQNVIFAVVNVRS